jgi:TetR/AcrR family transcriptional regulator, cholesterol catabolism regulator
VNDRSQNRDAMSEKPAPRKRGPKVDVELTRQRKADIVREAAHLFDKVGYHGVNMEMIAEAAGLKKPTLYHYITGKEEILFNMQDAMIVRMRENMKERIAAGEGCLAILLGVYEDIFTQLRDSPGTVRSFFEHQREMGTEQQGKIRKERQDYTVLLMKVISDGMDAGILLRGDVRLTALCFFGICNWAYQWYRPARDGAPEAMAKQCFDIFARGIAAKR